MQTEALKLAEHSAQTGQPELLSWGTIELHVTDLERAISFWTNVIGLQICNKDKNSAALGTTDNILFVLRSGATKPASPNYLGMYHAAIGVPTQAEFSRLFKRFLDMGVQVAPVDHLMSKALYVKDPDGLEIEIAFETPERFGSFGNGAPGPLMFDSTGQPHSGREPLDVEYELSVSPKEDFHAPISNTATIAHLHLRVSDLESATQWFEGVGFARNLMLPEFGLADMGTGAAYTHRLAMNIWSGRDLQPTPKDRAGLTRYTLITTDPAIMSNAKELTQTEMGLAGIDPTGTRLLIVSSH